MAQLTRDQIFEILTDSFGLSYPANLSAGLVQVSELLIPGVYSSQMASAMYDIARLSGKNGDVGAAINNAIAQASNESGMVFIPGGVYNLLTPIVPKYDVSVILSPKTIIHQRCDYGIENPATSAVERFSISGGLWVYSHPSPSTFHAIANLRGHSNCDIDVVGAGYADQMLALLKPAARINSTNVAFNRYRLATGGTTAQKACRIGAWLQGLETNYAELVGTGSVATLVANFQTKWPAEYLVAVWEKSTGLIRRLTQGVDYSVNSGSTGILEYLSVTTLAPVPIGDILMVWPGSATTPGCPITNCDFEFNISYVGQAALYAARYADAIGLSGYARITKNGAAHVIMNSFGLGNGETDYYTWKGMVCGQQVPDSTTVAILRAGPGSTSLTGSIQFDRVYESGAFIFSDRGVTTLTGTVTITNGSATVTGSGTSFTTEINASELASQGTRIRVPDTGQEWAISTIVSDTELLLAVDATESFTGVCERSCQSDGITAASIVMSQSGGGGVNSPVVTSYKPGHSASWSVTMPAGQTSVFAVYPWPLNRKPTTDEITLEMVVNLVPRGFGIGSIGERGFTINMSSAAGTDLVFNCRVNLARLGIVNV